VAPALVQSSKQIRVIGLPATPGDVALRITVRLFASYREKAKTSQIVLDLSEGANVKTLVDEVCSSYPDLTSTPDSLVVAINSEYQDHSFPLNDGDEAALIPPVSGGNQ
jgi:molybdopterin converting factor subunit 1